MLELAVSQPKLDVCLLKKKLKNLILTTIQGAIHYYTCNTSMIDKAFYNCDGDFLIGKEGRKK